MTVVRQINGLKVKEVFPEDETTQEQWYELVERVALVLADNQQAWSVPQIQTTSVCEFIEDPRDKLYVHTSCVYNIKK